MKTGWLIVFFSGLVITHSLAQARDLEVDANSGEIGIFVNPNEPTQVQFPSDISGGFMKKRSTVSLDRRGSDLIIFPRESVNESGEAIIVRLEDGRSYSLRVKKATTDSPRDDFVTINDERGSIVMSKEEEEPPHKEQKFDYAPPTKVSGFMREMVLAAEFGKTGVPGYRRSDKYKGQVVINDGTLIATIDSIFIGPNMWGYVIDASNVLDQTQKLNPASFRLDGTRAISATRWELSPRPLSVEHQVAGDHSTKVYVVTRSRGGK